MVLSENGDKQAMNAAERTEIFDKIILCSIGFILLYSFVILFQAYFNGADIAEWIWERHQNQFSWYSRPLFIVPACYYAYRHKLWHVLGFNLLLATSLFWFSAPEQIPASVSGYLEWEKQLFFSNESLVPLILLSSVVLLFLLGLFYAFWQRNPWYGLLLINIGTVMKIIVSVVLGKEAGLAAIIPSLSSIAIINFVAFLIWKTKK